MKKYLTQRYKWMENYIAFRADRTSGRKSGCAIIFIKATKAVDAEQLIAKSNSYVEYQLMHMQKTALLLLMCTVLQTALQKNLPAPWVNYEQN